MKKQAVIVILISLILTACNQNKNANQIPSVNAAIDSVAIASDTLQEKSLEQSYEYAQTVIVNPKLVYDVRAYDGPATHGKYCIIRRGPDNKPDTVVEGERNGVIVNAFTADLNNNGHEEIYIVTRSADTTRAENIIANEFDGHGKATSIIVHFGEDKTWNYQGQDSVFLNNKIISRLFPFFDKENKPMGWMRIQYSLNKNVLDHFSAEALSKNWHK